MKPQAIDYGTSVASRARPGRRRWIAAAILAIVLLAWAAASATYEVWTDMDAVTGSTSVHSRWPLGIQSGPPKVAVSPIEARLRAIGATWSPRWRFYQGNEISLLSRSCGLGNRPAVSRFQFGQALFTAAATDAEVIAFARVMEFGTEEEQEAAVKAAMEKVWPADPPAAGSPPVTRPVPTTRPDWALRSK